MAMSFRYELACKGHSTEKAQYLVTQQNDLCCFIGLTFTLYLKRSFFTIIIIIVIKLFSKRCHMQLTLINKQ